MRGDLTNASPNKYCSIKMRQTRMEFRTWGGRRVNAGRKRRHPHARPNVPHRARAGHKASHPVHVTLRARAGLPPFRENGIFAEMRKALRGANRSPAVGERFRVVHFSIQRDHVHFIIEAHDAITLARGTQGLAIRLARAVNRALHVRGKVWGDRFHARELTTPRAVRNAIVYVLMNARKHGARIASGIDAFSSARWFDGFSRAPRASEEPSIVVAAKTWLGGIGWRRRGLVRFDERPRAPD